MNLDGEGRLKLLIAVDAGRDELERIRTSTPISDALPRTQSSGSMSSTRACFWERAVCSTSLSHL